jgi:hypothetical protein
MTGPVDPQDHERAAVAAVEEFLAHSGLEVERLDDRTWYTMLSGEHKRTVPVYIEVSERHLGMQSFFMRAPDENEAALYRYLLGRHLRSYIHRFAVAEDGDLLIVGILPLAGVTVAELDRAVGQLLSLADEAFDSALRLGFASYIEREQEWRGRQGMARNPIT